jgi:hypothetical protein
MKYALIVLMFLSGVDCFAQNTSQEMKKPKDSYAFGQIYTSFRYSLKNTFKPQAAFNFNQGIIGYRHKVSDKLSGIIIYDVTRTTRIDAITDTAGNTLTYDYFEGSKYTSYLKMAEIKWSINEYLDFRVGQLLSTQYLTFTDRFWGFRYVDVTFQELFRLGMPADFGAQLDFKYKGKFLNQFSIVNGEGPFRHQDMNSKFIYANNIQYNPFEKLTLKLYADYSPVSDTGAIKSDKSVISAFAGYKTEKYRIGAEYVFISNFGYHDGNDYSGMSFFGSYQMNERFTLLARYDYLYRKQMEENKQVDYYIVGFQYEPVKTFTTSINFRYYSVGAIPFIYANFGLKF